MNYRHAFHAGNFADVFKHALLARVLVYLKQKPAPLRFIDTHAGRGAYDLGGEEATRGDEWRDGVGRILAATPPPDIAALLAPWLDVVRSEDGGLLRRYPGSPALARALLGSADRLVLNELHPRDVLALQRACSGDRRVKVMNMDGYAALNASVPPPERRGLVLVDPPFEERDEFERMAQATIRAWRKWPTGIYALWYPLKRPDEAAGFLRALVEAGLRKILRLELDVATWRAEGPLGGNGLIVVNPPHTLENEARVMLPWLAGTLARGAGATTRIDWLIGE